MGENLERPTFLQQPNSTVNSQTAKQVPQTANTTTPSTTGSNTSILAFLDRKPGVLTIDGREIETTEDDYELVRKLGNGAHGAVNLCRVKGAEVAIKVALSSKQEDVEELINEVKIMSLGNPGSVKFYGALEFNTSTLSSCKLIMEPMRSCVERLLVNHKPLPASVGQLIVKCLLNALDWLIERNIYHRDIKGGNLLIDQNGYVKLADYGAAINVALSPNLAIKKGTLAFMPPESFSDDWNVDFVRFHDPWSVGIVVVEMVTGSHPYEKYSDFPELAIVTGPAPRLKNDSYSLNTKNFVEMALKKDPEQRASIRELSGSEWMVEASEESMAADRRWILNRC